MCPTSILFLFWLALPSFYLCFCPPLSLHGQTSIRLSQLGRRNGRLWHVCISEWVWGQSLWGWYSLVIIHLRAQRLCEVMTQAIAMWEQTIWVMFYSTNGLSAAGHNPVNMQRGTITSGNENKACTVRLLRYKQPHIIWSSIKIRQTQSLKRRLTENSMFFLSWLTARGSGTGSVCLRTDTDSPVRMDWSTLRVVERMEVSLMSAGTLSPTEKTKVLFLGQIFVLLTESLQTPGLHNVFMEED